MTPSEASAGTRPRLARADPAPPVRIVHLGLGAFVRAHLAWYTDRAPDAAGWGIAAFTGRSPQAASDLAEQGGRYTLVTRGPREDRMDPVDSLASVHASTDHDAYLGHLRRPAVSILSLTMTEAGYCRAAGGGLDLAREDVRADVRALRADRTALVRTAPARILAGLLARAAAGVGPVSVVPLDNLPGNGPATARLVRELAVEVSPHLLPLLDHVEFVSTVVDRITPRATAADRAAVADATGRRDEAPVVTEPFSEWVLAGGFPAGRPRWEDAGAQFVPDVTPFEQRKLWLLNGSHSLLAYAGSIRGHRTVADAVADPRCRDWVAQWCEQAARHLPFAGEEVAAYRAVLLDRFANPRIRHELAQVAADGSEKLPVRVLPVVRAERAAGRVPGAGARVLAAWVLHLRGLGTPVADPRAERFTALAGGDLDRAVPAVLADLAPDLANDPAVVRAVLDAARDLTPRPDERPDPRPST